MSLKRNSEIRKKMIMRKIKREKRLNYDWKSSNVYALLSTIPRDIEFSI